MPKVPEVTWDLPVVVTMMEGMDMVQVQEVKTKLALEVMLDLVPGVTSRQALEATLVRVPEVALVLVLWEAMRDLALEVKMKLALEVMLDLVPEVMKDQTAEVMKEPPQEVTKELLLEVMKDLAPLEVTLDLEAMQDLEVKPDLALDLEATQDLEVTPDLEVTLELSAPPAAFADADLTDFEFTR